MFRFAAVNWFWMLAVIPLCVFLWRRSGRPTMYFSSQTLLKGLEDTSKWRRRIKIICRSAALALIIIALARPQWVSQSEQILTRGIDIVLTLDLSSSMKALDFKPSNRLRAAKDVIRDFIGRRKSDRIGAVVFAALSYTQCPLTTDYNVLLDLIEQVDIGMIEDGTAIGMALATSVKRLKDSDAKSKIVILLTDGDNNAGEVDPVTAAKLAKTMGIKVYTVGMGKEGEVPFPVTDAWGQQRYVMVENTMNEAVLKRIAEETGGQFFRAENKRALEDIYKQIDQLEKTDVKINTFYRYQEFFIYALALALLFLTIEFVWTYFWMRQFP